MSAAPRLALGHAADIAIFDPDRIGSASRGERRFDLPGGAKRMVMPSRGVEYTIVNGQIVYADGRATGATPGEAPRSYRARTPGPGGRPPPAPAPARRGFLT